MNTFKFLLLLGLVYIVDCDDYCPNVLSKTCDPSIKYYSFDGTCNNLVKPSLGSANSPFKRYLNPAYDDGVGSPRTLSVTGSPLPNPRLISRQLSADNSLTENSFTHLIASFGQFLDHDLTSQLGSRDPDGRRPSCPCNSTNPICFSVKIIQPDTFPIDCLQFVRSAAAPLQPDCNTGFRQQVNQMTSFIDNNQVYGQSESSNLDLRTKNGGLLLTTPGITRRNYLPQSSSSCSKLNSSLQCFRAGESRTSENMILTSVHTLFLREHNRIATELAQLNPKLNDSTLFFEARRISIAITQHIIYNEFLSTIIDPFYYDAFDLSPRSSGFFLGYDQTVNPAISTDFAAAAFRFGHSLIKEKPARYNQDYTKIDNYNISKVILLVDEAYNIPKMGLESIMRGEFCDTSSKLDTNVADTLLNHLFEATAGIPVDLPALNINRGRDHGLPSYVKYRNMCGLKNADGFSDLNGEIPTEQINLLKSVYQDVSDIDLWIGGLSEKSRSPSALLGPTFSCIIGKEFRDLKYGDRLFYENGPNKKLGTKDTSFKARELAEIKKVTLSGLICNNFDIDSIQINAFKMVSKDNLQVPCSLLRSQMDLKKFKF